jgi:hypothetical protein
MHVNSEFITIRFFNDTGKTKIYEIVTKDDTKILGYIKWFGAWRCYAFYPEPHTVFETTCMKDIVEALSQLNNEHKLQQKIKRQKKLVNGQ